MKSILLATLMAAVATLLPSSRSQYSLFSTQAAALCPATNSQPIVGTVDYQGCTLTQSFALSMSSAAVSFSLSDSTVTTSDADGVFVVFLSTGLPFSVLFSNVHFAVTSSSATLYPRALCFTNTITPPAGSMITITGCTFELFSSTSNAMQAIAFDGPVLSSSTLIITDNTLHAETSGGGGTTVFGVRGDVATDVLATGNTFTLKGTFSHVRMLDFSVNVPTAATAPHNITVRNNTMDLAKYAASGLNTFFIYYARSGGATVTSTIPLQLTAEDNICKDVSNLLYYRLPQDQNKDFVSFVRNTATNARGFVDFILSARRYETLDISNNTLAPLGRIELSVSSSADVIYPKLSIDRNNIRTTKSAAVIEVSLSVPSALTGSISAEDNFVTSSLNNNVYVSGSYKLFGFDVTLAPGVSMALCGNTFMGFQPATLAELVDVSTIAPGSSFAVNSCPTKITTTTTPTSTTTPTTTTTPTSTTTPTTTTTPTSTTTPTTTTPTTTTTPITTTETTITITTDAVVSDTSVTATDPTATTTPTTCAASTSLVVTDVTPTATTTRASHNGGCACACNCGSVPTKPTRTTTTRTPPLTDTTTNASDFVVTPTAINGSVKSLTGPLAGAVMGALVGVLVALMAW